MNRPFEVYDSQDKIAIRRVLFAIELFDAVTLERVSQGVEVKAHGLQGKPIVNSSMMYVWLHEDIEPLQKITIDAPGLPYETVELEGDEVKAKLAEQEKLRPIPIELPPSVNYNFAAGVTGLRGTLVENRTFLEPVSGAEVSLSWLAKHNKWTDAPIKSHTTAKTFIHKGGDFVAILRLAPSQAPLLDTNDKITVRVRFKRDDDERRSADLGVPQGRVTSLSTPNQSVFAWDELKQ
jgi:hypothetical protein